MIGADVQCRLPGSDCRSPLQRHERSVPSATRRLGWAIRLCLLGNVAAMGMLTLMPARAGELPLPPPDSAPLPLHLDLVLNQVETGRRIIVQERAGQLYASAEALRAAGVTLPPSITATEIALEQVPGLQVGYDRALLRLMLDVPPAWLSRQTVDYREATPKMSARVSPGAIFNYDVYVNDVQGDSGYMAAWNELRIFGGAGSLISTGQYRRSFGGRAGGHGQTGYRRYDTTWRFSDEDSLLTYEAGDVVTGALPWSNAFRLGGVQLSRDFGVRPDLVTYPIPQFAGEVAVPTALDLFVNGYKSSSTELNPGPYTLTNIPLINGAGEAVVVTTDALGRQVSTTLPFYVSTRLLQPGLVDFSVAAGKLRNDYAIRNFSYGEAAGSGTLRYGVTDWLTLEGHAEAASGLSLAGGGANVRMGNLGVVNTAVSQSRFQGRSGQQFALGYQYNAPWYSLAYQRLQRQSGYADLGAISTQTLRASRRSEQATVSARLGSWGSAGLGYFDVRNPDDSRSRLLNLSWSRSWRRGLSFFLSANRDVETGGWSAAAQLTVPMGARNNFAVAAERDRRGELRERVNFSRQTPTDGGFGYSFGYAHGDGDDYRQMDATWRGDVVQLQAGIYGSAGAMTRWGGISGSTVWMDGHFFAGNRVDDAFVVVSTNGYAGVPVRYENQSVGRTGKSGHLLVPWSRAYYPAKYELDMLNLPADVRSSRIEERVMVRARSGYLLEFPVMRVRAASLVLTDANGRSLALGSGVRHQETGVSTVVGWDGLVYLENVGKENHLQVTLADGSNCSAAFSADEGSEPILMTAPLVCR